MVLIKTEVPVDQLSLDHPARRHLARRADIVPVLPHPAQAPHIEQAKYEHQFSAYTNRHPSQTSYHEPAQVQRGMQSLDYEMQLMMLEQQNKKRLLLARLDQQNLPAYNLKDSMDTLIREQVEIQKKLNALPSDCSRHDYKYQMLLHEQEILRRAEEAQTEEYRKRQGLQEYQFRLMMLEQSNKKKLMMARAAVNCDYNGANNEYEVANERDDSQDVVRGYPLCSPPPGMPRSRLPGSPGTTCSPPSTYVQYPQPASTLVIRGGPPAYDEA